MRTVGNAPSARSSYSFDRDTPNSCAAAGIVTNRTCPSKDVARPASNGPAAIFIPSMLTLQIDVSRCDRVVHIAAVVHGHGQGLTPQPPEL